MTSMTKLDPELCAALKKLKLGPVIDTLPERLTLAKKTKMSFEEILLLVLRDEIDRRARAPPPSGARGTRDSSATWCSNDGTSRRR